MLEGDLDECCSTLRVQVLGRMSRWRAAWA